MIKSQRRYSTYLTIKIHIPQKHFNYRAIMQFYVHTHNRVSQDDQIKKQIYLIYYYLQ